MYIDSLRKTKIPVEKQHNRESIDHTLYSLIFQSTSLYIQDHFIRRHEAIHNPRFQRPLGLVFCHALGEETRHHTYHDS